MTLDPSALLSSLRERDVKVWLEDGRLKVNAPAGAIDAAMKAELAARKEEILAHLARAEALHRAPSSVVPIKPEGGRQPLFALSGHGGDVYAMRPLARVPSRHSAASPPAARGSPSTAT